LVRGGSGGGGGGGGGVMHRRTDRQTDCQLQNTMELRLDHTSRDKSHSL